MEFILDFQGFQNDQEYIIKELAIISTDGKIYELHLFLPPYSIHQLPQYVRKQVHWIEKHLHGLYWSSGFKEYSQVKDIFKQVDIRGNVYVKGAQKQVFISQLLLDFDVKVINLEDLGCPKLSVLKQQTQINLFKPCNFSHSLHNCAYINVHILLNWWNTEKKFTSNLMENIDAAIREWNERGSLMQDEMVKYLPKQFIIDNVRHLECIYDKLPLNLKADPDIIDNLRCQQHYQFDVEVHEIDGPFIKRKYCYFCRNGLTFDPKAVKEGEISATATSV